MQLLAAGCDECVYGEALCSSIVQLQIVHLESPFLVLEAIINDCWCHEGANVMVR